MLFDKEYRILTTLNSEEILEIAFSFNKNNIKLYYSQNKSNFFLLICENKKVSFIKNYAIYFVNNKAHINGYWGNLYKYAELLKTENNFNLFLIH